MKIEDLRKNYLYVGRAATAIYLILRENLKDSEVILPANICYAAVYPIIYSGNIPVFSDVDINTGNATYESIIEKVTSKTKAIIYPYMYGNTNCDILKIKNYCNKNEILLIEDCASVMGAKVDNKLAGTIGDYAIFSTGHAKIVDVGNGGVLVTDNNINELKNLYKKLPFYDKTIDDKLTEFSKEYRKLRNTGDLNQQKEFFKKDYKDLFLYQISDKIENQMIDKIKEACKILSNREEKYNLFLNELTGNNEYYILKYSDGSTPWRFTIITNDPQKRRKLINILLEEKLFVSDWYPNIGKIFTNESFPNSDYMEDRILNFSLEDDSENIKKICKKINKYLGAK